MGNPEARAGGPLPRYVVAGGLAFVTDLAITLALSQAVHYLVANTVAFFLANLGQFFLVHRWVFGRPLRGQRLLPPYLATLGISLAGLGASTLIVSLGVGFLGQPLAGVKCVAAVVVLLLNYALRAGFVYRRR